MQASAGQPELIISLSRDKVTFDLSEPPMASGHPLRSSFDVDALFMDDQIAHAIDDLLYDNPALLEDLNCVDIILLDRPNLALPAFYNRAKAVEIASRYLRLRSGDLFTADHSGNLSFCYTVPESTWQLLKEYYANSRITHLTSLLWFSINHHITDPDPDALYFTIVQKTLTVLCAHKGKLNFARNFNITSEADLVYYVVACSRLLNHNQLCEVTIENQISSFGLNADFPLPIDRQISLPRMHALMAQYKPCES